MVRTCDIEIPWADHVMLNTMDTSHNVENNIDRTRDAEHVRTCDTEITRVAENTTERTHEAK